jgi:hypothetical protein
VPEGVPNVRSPTVTVSPLEEAGVTPDPDNARLHTPRNIGVIEDSMQTDGAGRSILVDQDGVTIAGAGAWEAVAYSNRVPIGTRTMAGGRSCVVAHRRDRYTCGYTGGMMRLGFA